MRKLIDFEHNNDVYKMTCKVSPGYLCACACATPEYKENNSEIFCNCSRLCSAEQLLNNKF